MSRTENAQNASKQGFTLIEVIMVLFFAGILMTVLFVLYDWHSKIYGYQQAMVRSTTAVRTAFGDLNQYAAQASAVLASASIGGTVYNSGTQTLVLQLPAADSAGNILPGHSDLAVFYLSGSNLYLKLQPDQQSFRKPLDKLLAEGVVSLVFSYNDPDFTAVKRVGIDLASSQQIKQQTVTSHLRQNIDLKNY